MSTAGINFADTHQIENSYLSAQKLPLVPGAEFVGTPEGGGRRVVGLLDADATVDPALADDEPRTFTGALREANGGRPVDVVLEMTGGNVFDGALSALAPFGRLVAYGMAARTPPSPVQSPALMQKSRAVIGFWLAHCMGRPHMMDAAMGELLPMVAEGALRPVVGGRYPLSDVGAAHQDLLARRTTGKLVLDPAR